ncbi:hypothetical protein TNCV_5044591 [Trichonephila clavipes]|uniref:Uncharacterized protein n=1 Tax=Trichonephila clavipes TaxID=2585209 RepID=A0A8X6WIT2_TRICX|nr:hypothetical protein TNCV_5044591 [Trichonephila clavipes]
MKKGINVVMPNDREKKANGSRTATAGSDVVQSGRPIFDDFFQHLWPYIGNKTMKKKKKGGRTAADSGQSGWPVVACSQSQAVFARRRS